MESWFQQIFGKSMAYSLENAQERGVLFITPGVDVYEGMIIGLNSRDQDMDINVTKGQAKTNVRSANKEMKIALTAPIEMSIDQALDFIEDDELIEITPENIRLRKKFLSKNDRVRQCAKTKQYRIPLPWSNPAFYQFFLH